MKKKFSIIETILGFVIFLGGLFTYGMGIHDLLPVPRPDLIVTGSSLFHIPFSNFEWKSCLWKKVRTCLKCNGKETE